MNEILEFFNIQEPGQLSLEIEELKSLNITTLCCRTRWSHRTCRTATSTARASLCWRMCATLCRSSAPWCWSWRCAAWLLWDTSAPSACCRPAVTAWRRHAGGNFAFGYIKLKMATTSSFLLICCDGTEGVCMCVCLCVYLCVCVCVTALQPKQVNGFWWRALF